MAAWDNDPIVRPAVKAGGASPWQNDPIVKPAGGGDAFANASAMSQKLKGPVPQKPESYDESYVAQGMSGLNEGLGNLMGLPVDLATLGINLGTTGVNAAFGTDIPQIENPALGSVAINRTLGNLGAVRPETDDPGKQFLRRTAQDVGAAVLPALGTAGAAARPLAMVGKELAMGLGSGAGAAAAEQIAPDNQWAELAGQILGSGGVAGAIGAGKKLITPFPTSPERIAAADAMAAEGVELTAGQRTGSKGLQYAESELGGARIGDINEQQAEQFTKAALARIGENANRASPEVLKRAYQRIGADFEDIGARNTIQADQQMAADLRQTWQDYAGNTAPNDRAPNVQKFISDIAEAIRNNNGMLDGKTYISLRSRLGELARGASNAERKEAYYGIQHALDDAMERNMSTADIEQFRNARREYRNFIVIEQAATGAGSDTALGLIFPAQLRNAAVTKQGRRNYAQGSGDFSELARGGVATMSPLPQSGTAPRTAVRNLSMGIPGMIGAGIGGGAGGIPGALMGMAAGAAIPKVAGAAMLSGPGRAYLANQLLDGVPSGSNGIGPIAAALTGQTGDMMEGRRRPLQITVRGGN